MAQALQLSNGDVINARLRAAGSAVEKLVTAVVGDKEAIDGVYLAAFCRYPTSAELAKTLPLLQGEPPGPKPAPSAEMKKQSRRAALEDLYWAVLTSREFAFNH